MTISTATSRVTYIGNAATTSFSYPFKIFNDSELRVTVRDAETDVETVLDLDSDYTVTGARNAAGGNVVMTTAPANGDIVTIRRVLPLTQTTAIRNSGTMFRSTMEDALDRARMIDLQQQDELDRSFKLPETVDPDDVSVELPVPSAQRVLGWNVTGSALENVTLDDSDNVALPSDGRAVPSLTDYLANNARGMNILDFAASTNEAANLRTRAIDATPFWQAAIDASAAKYANDARGVPIIIPEGEYSLQDTLDWKSMPMVGAGPNNSVRVFWDGDDDVLAIDLVAGFPGGASFGGMTGLDFRNGTGRPSSWLRINTAVDRLFRLYQCHFRGTNGDAIQVTAGWYNLHWSDVGFNDILGGYAIDAAPFNNQNLSSFLLERFTYDHQGPEGSGTPTTAGPGFIRFDNSVNASNVGTACIRDCRIEVNTEWATPQALVTLKSPTSTPNTRWLGLNLTNISYQDVVGMANDVLIHHEGGTAAAVPCTLILENVRAEGLSAVLSGNWGSGTGAVSIPLPSGATFPYTVLRNVGDVMEIIGDARFTHFLEGVEISDPAAPSADRARLYVRDNGAGKTQLVVRFPTGAVQVIATEP